MRSVLLLCFCLTLVACSSNNTPESTLIAAPVANDDSAETTSGQFINIDVLDNDEGSSVTLESYQTTTNLGGAISKTVQEELRYTPADGFTGVDTFTYVNEDSSGNESNSATVTVTVR